MEDVLQLLDNLLSGLESEIEFDHFSYSFIEDRSAMAKLSRHGYVPAESSKFHALALNSRLSQLVENKWALFPDHVVFLGRRHLLAIVMRLHNA